MLLTTYTGKKFDVNDFENFDFDIKDIARGLSNLCRFGGQCENFYSVAQHSVLVSHLVPPHLAREALLHDATEAYMVDLPRPIKNILPAYSELEDKVAQAIFKQYGLNWPMPAEVKEADKIALVTECRVLFPGDHYKDWENNLGVKALMTEFRCANPWEAREYFMQRFNELFNERKGMEEVKQQTSE